MSSKVTLALDLGTTLGWAIFHGTKRYDSGIIKFKRRTRKKIKEPRAVLWLQFIDALELSIVDGDPIPLLTRPDVIAFEHVKGHWLSAGARESYGGYLAQLEISSLQSGIPLAGLPISGIKKHATGYGNARKDEMEAAARRIWRGVRLASHDEADALHIGRAYVDGAYP